MSFFNGLALVLNKNYTSYKNKYLGVSVMIYSLFLLSYVWWYQEKLILQLPHLMRSTNPLMFLTMPFFYFFVRNTLNSEDSLRKYDWLHFLPAILHFIDLIPFYLLPIETKLVIAEKLVQDPKQLDLLAYGFIPGVWINIFRLSLQFAYYGYVIHILFRKQVKKTWGQEAVSVRNWLLVAIVLIGLLLMAHLFFVVRNLLDISEVELPYGSEYIATFLIVLPIILLNLYMRFNQHLVYGYTINSMIHEKKNKIKAEGNQYLSNPQKSEKSVFHDVDLTKLEQDLLLLMTEKKVYLNPDILLKEMANLLSVNQRVLSQFIKMKYGVGFKEYVNQFRINAAIELLKEGYLETRSLDGLCQSTGFNSRITFFLAFKKSTGMGPTEYIKQVF